MGYEYNSAQPHAASKIGGDVYEYDKNGNVVFIDRHDLSQRRFVWDDADRLSSVQDDYRQTSFFYDHSGERVIKSRSSGRLVYVNGQLVQSLSGVHDNFTTYVSPEYIVDNEYTYTKFVYMGSRRITAKVCDGSAETPPKPDPRGNEPNTDYENLQFFFHSDHLGSTSYMTDLSGEVSQHVEYFPYGGLMVEERSSSTENPYLFNGKELDLETGLYYYGARYADSDGSIFLGVDRFSEKFPWQSPYAHTGNNPINLVDVNGDSTVVNKFGNILFSDDREGKGDGEVYSQIDGGLNQIGEIGKNIKLDGIIENILNSNSEEAKDMGWGGWGSKVLDENGWDYKNNKETIFGLIWSQDRSTTFSFGKHKELTSADFGNYHYGYIGKFTNGGEGFYTLTLMIGAGLAESGKNIWNIFTLDFSGAEYLLPWNNTLGDRDKDAIWNITGMMDANKAKRKNK